MPPERDTGFTLVEVLVALVVTSLLLGIVMNGALQAKADGMAAEKKRDAFLLAGTLVAERKTASFSSTDAEGTTGDLMWRVTEQPISTDPRGLFVLASIRVRVSDQRGVPLSDLQLSKLKAVPAK